MDNYKKAFPNKYGGYGMDLRGFFATHAPEVSNAFTRNSKQVQLVQAHQPDSIGNTRSIVMHTEIEPYADYVARWAYVYADAMLKAREVQNG